VASYDAASIISGALGRGVMRSKRRAVQYMRESANSGNSESCASLAGQIYRDQPYAREVGHVVEAAGVAPSAGIMEGHDVPPDVLVDVVYWLQKGGVTPTPMLFVLQRSALEGANCCVNEGCEVVGHMKDLKVCPQCRVARYCGAACQKEDWTTGGHKTRCGTANWKSR
jgi:hypothetical protein